MPVSLLVATIGLIYSSLSPVICPVALAYFTLALFVYKYNTMFVYAKPFEMGGVLWATIARRMIVAAIIYQVQYNGHLLSFVRCGMTVL